MKPEEANKIIAEFMGWKPHLNLELIELKTGTNEARKEVDYTQSLDALIPVWEKLPCFDLLINKHSNGITVAFDSFDFETFDSNYEIWVKRMGKAKTIQEAAAIATAKAIQELT